MFFSVKNNKKYLILKQKLITWHQLNKKDKRLFWEAFLFLTYARLIVLLIPFKVIGPRLGAQNKETTSKENIQVDSAKAIATAIRLAVRYIPWKTVCLPQAIAANRMLKRRKLSGILYLGLARDDEKTKGLKAHAWLRHGETIVCGAKGHQQFAVVSTFYW